MSDDSPVYPEGSDMRHAVRFIKIHLLKGLALLRLVSRALAVSAAAPSSPYSWRLYLPGTLWVIQEADATTGSEVTELREKGPEDLGGARGGGRHLGLSCRQAVARASRSAPRGDPPGGGGRRKKISVLAKCRKMIRVCRSQGAAVVGTAGRGRRIFYQARSGSFMDTSDVSTTLSEFTPVAGASEAGLLPLLSTVGGQGLRGGGLASVARAQGGGGAERAGHRPPAGLGVGCQRGRVGGRRRRRESGDLGAGRGDAARVRVAPPPRQVGRPSGRRPHRAICAAWLGRRAGSRGPAVWRVLEAQTGGERRGGSRQPCSLLPARPRRDPGKHDPPLRAGAPLRDTCPLAPFGSGRGAPADILTGDAGTTGCRPPAVLAAARDSPGLRGPGCRRRVGLGRSGARILSTHRLGSWPRQRHQAEGPAARSVDMWLLLLLLLPLLVPMPGSATPKVRRQSDTWGPWGEWSPCSRTCGVGISFRERPCYTQRRDGGASCVGPGRSHRTCLTESCPDGALDFRAQQCAELDGAAFQGRQYRWLPYHGAPNKCELNCIPEGENFYYKHREAVVDGTPCEPGGRDLCVDGSCRVVGCDYQLDSSKQEDKCLQCGGDGTTCYPVTGTFNANDLSRGYNQIFIIPPGATSICIEEAAASRNFLAVRSVRGEYYLNGHWTIAAAQTLPVASTILHYMRGSEGDLSPEQLQALGPTSEPLVIELISQEANPGVYYEYYLPLHSLGPRGGVSWSHGSWSDCSVSCDGGHQSRPVFCTIGSEVYPDHMCQPELRPADHRSCNPHPCPQTKRTFYLYRPGAWMHPAGAPCMCGNSWMAGPWASCSASCGGGSQSRRVSCVSADGAVDEAGCAGLPGKPPSTQACNLQRCATWDAEPWGKCSVTCGAGIRKRSVACRGDEGSPLPASACSSEDQPPLTEPCERAACPTGHDRAWRVGAWSLCSKSCSQGTRRRQVVCALGPPGHCGSLQQRKPAEVQSCNTQPCHRPQEVPSVQDLSAHPRDPWTPLVPQEAPASGSSDQQQAAQEQLWALSHPRDLQGLHLSVPGPAISLQQSLRSGLGAQDCRRSPHGCCPDGHTVSLGPQWQGCPGIRAWCQQSRYGCCPDGVSVAKGPLQSGCPGSHSSDDTRRRPGARAVASMAPRTHQLQPQQSEPSECRGSRFGCCYDNVASAAGPLGEGCADQPSYDYPVRCLLPSAHGSCADWAARWYFIASVGQCNRFWYGGCHGNANNFASEQECLSSCRGPRPESGRSGPSTHTYGGSNPRGEQEPDRHRMGVTDPRLPLPSGGPWQTEREPGLGQVSPTQAFGVQPRGQELGPRTPGLGGDASWPVPPYHSSSYRSGLAGSEPSLVQAALGQLVQLFCSSDTFLEAQTWWQKDGWPISSDRHQLQSDGSLVISPLRAEDAGIYSCGSRPGRDSQKIQLRITGSHPVTPSEAAVRHVPQTRDPGQDHGPRDSSLGRDAGGSGAVSSHPEPATRVHLDRTQPDVVDASPGQRVRLTCRAEGFPPPVTEWQRDGQPPSSPRYQMQLDGSLVISPVALEDDGFYTCIAFNGRDRDQRWVQLRVLGALKITGLPTTVTVPEGDTARLPCVVAEESVNIRWSRNGLPVQADGRRVHQSPDGMLMIHNLRARDEGSYTCSAYRGNQAVSRSTEVKVAPPAVAAQPKDPGGECIDQPALANCALILQAQLCGNGYYSSFCCASCARSQAHMEPIWQRG
ncbi:LOW QUALITY PROTEIN: papilin [Ctenodactylus gundi]